VLTTCIFLADQGHADEQGHNSDMEEADLSEEEDVEEIARRIHSRQGNT